MPSFFRENIKALTTRDPELARRMAALEPDTTIKTTETASGAFTAFQSAPNGRTLYFHSRVDPLEEGAAWGEAAAPRERCVFIIGMGLGYHIRALVERGTGLDSIHVIEASLPLFQTALRTVDLSSLFANRKLQLWIGHRREDFKTMIFSQEVLFTYHLYLPVLALDPEYYEVIIRLLEKRLYEIRRNHSSTAEADNPEFFGRGIERLMNEMTV